MRFKNKNIKIGQIVRVVIQYNPNYHSMRKDREHVGFVSQMEDYNGNKSIILTHKKIKVNFKDKIHTETKFWKMVKNMPQLIMQSNFGISGLYITQEEVKEIEILKEIKK